MTIVVVGTGHAGVQLVDSLRAEGYEGRLVLIGEEDSLPYQRPQLSKDLMISRDTDTQLLPLRGEDFYTDARVERRTGSVISIDRVRRALELSDGSTIEYGHLVLATGASSRQLGIPGANEKGVRLLRSESDARALHPDLLNSVAPVIIGAGFVGMEIAAAAAGHGLLVTIISPRPPLARSVSAPTSSHLAQALKRRGARIVTGEPRAIRAAGQRNRIVELNDGRAVEADLIVIGVGAVPRIELAVTAGLAVRDGIVVDEYLTTSDPAISAIGDCAEFTISGDGGTLRVESVPNATDQARYLARRIVRPDAADAYRARLWFWSHQGDQRLDIAGLARVDDDVLVRSSGESQFSVLRFRHGRLVAVESVNSPREHMAARRLFEAGVEVSHDEALREDFDLVAAMRAALATRTGV